eukprot:TRINITY_DN30382_c0_g1_i1.p1 TRINITY_DN30382_c0_g1~~TRINITY_DN30382_c0_g1_i1.p1  ORF type:complete len:434 (+),score=76.28 TRINITY_DN30382_c0_g1_i1:3-1304(+)
MSATGICLSHCGFAFGAVSLVRHRYFGGIRNIRNGSHYSGVVWRVAQDGHLGVIADKVFQAGDVVERCHSLFVQGTAETPVAKVTESARAGSRGGGLTNSGACAVDTASGIRGDNASSSSNCRGPESRDYGGEQGTSFLPPSTPPLLLPLGWGLLYNEVPAGGAPPNLTWDVEAIFDVDGNDKSSSLEVLSRSGARTCRAAQVVIRASRVVARGEELCVPRSPIGGVFGLWRIGVSANNGRDMLSLTIQDVSKELEVDLRYRGATRSRQLAWEQFAELVEPEHPHKCTGLANADACVDIATGALWLRPPVDVFVGPSPVHGYGVFARRWLQRGTVVEVAPTLVAMRSWLGSSLVDYRYRAFEPDNGVRKVILGNGSMYNHSDLPNVECCTVEAAGALARPVHRFCTRYITTKDVDAGEELFVSYGPNWWSSRS